ncbi:MAG: NAD(+)/NADH kinase [Clostridiales bacterium]|nr:NAD(+)/NADH kinase [Clostridiales bacterium]
MEVKMVFSVFANLYNLETQQIAKEILSVLEFENCSVFFDEKYENVIKSSVCFFAQPDDMYNLCDIAIVIGGDGTTMRVARNAAVLGKLTLGINAGRLGFLSALEKNEISLLHTVAKGNYQIDERIMLKTAVLNGESVVKTYHCLNDAIATRGAFARLIDIEVTSDGRELLETRADGIIISTPTGSTAYSLAAGGPVLSPDLECFVATAICPHSLMDRSIVVNSKSKLDIMIYSDVKNNAVLTCDGQEPFEISKESVIRVSLSEYKARLVKIKPDNFYEVVKKKIINNRT